MIFERRPWGWFWKIIHTRRFWLKILRVMPGHRTSSQEHKERAELHLWLGGFRWIPKEKVHWLIEGWYVELAFGHPREEDIIRYFDDYGRV